jgi:hypothetical protein
MIEKGVLVTFRQSKLGRQNKTIATIHQICEFTRINIQQTRAFHQFLFKASPPIRAALKGVSIKWLILPKFSPQNLTNLANHRTPNKFGYVLGPKIPRLASTPLSLFLAPTLL